MANASIDIPAECRPVLNNRLQTLGINGPTHLIIISQAESDVSPEVLYHYVRTGNDVNNICTQTQPWQGNLSAIYVTYQHWELTITFSEHRRWFGGVL